jgi:aarF domain-containing kinase
MKQMRNKMEQDEQLSALMAGFRGSNLNDADFASEGQRMAILEVIQASCPPPHTHLRRRID